MKKENYLFVSTLIFIATGYFLNLWLGRYLGPKLYGNYGIVISIISYVNVLQSSSITQSVSKYAASHRTQYLNILKTGFVMQSFAGTILFLLLFVSSKYLAQLFNDESLYLYIKLAAFSIPFYGFYSLLSDFNNGMHNFQTQAAINIYYFVSKFLLTIILLVFLQSLLGVFLSLILAPIPVLFWLFKIPFLKAKIFPFKALLVFSISLVAYAIFSYLQLGVDLYFVKYFFPYNEYTGLYTANQNITKIPYMFLGVLAVIIFPKISHSLSNKSMEETKKLIHQAIRITLLFLAPTVFIISATSLNLLNFLYSSDYVSASSSLAILVFGVGFLTFTVLFANILNGSGKPMISLLIAFFGVLITCSFCFILIPKFELIGAAIATTIGALFSMILGAFFVFRKFHTLIAPLRITKIIIASVIIYLIAKSIPLSNVYLLPFLYIFLAIIYGTVLFIFREITGHDLLLIRNTLPFRITKLEKESI
jgi:O-antigen/teichoic acid export membrane protein